jgi:hypothetical protein
VSKTGHTPHALSSWLALSAVRIADHVLRTEESLWQNHSLNSPTRWTIIVEVMGAREVTDGAFLFSAHSQTTTRRSNIP